MVLLLPALLAMVGTDWQLPAVSCQLSAISDLPNCRTAMLWGCRGQHWIDAISHSRDAPAA